VWLEYIRVIPSETIHWQEVGSALKIRLLAFATSRAPASHFSGTRDSKSFVTSSRSDYLPIPATVTSPFVRCSTVSARGLGSYLNGRYSTSLVHLVDAAWVLREKTVLLGLFCAGLGGGEQFRKTKRYIERVAQAGTALKTLKDVATRRRAINHCHPLLEYQVDGVFTSPRSSAIQLPSLEDLASWVLERVDIPLVRFPHDVH
jgi:hypothetical protein